MTTALGITCSAIRVEQPIGVFYAFTLDASTLNRITYSQPAEVVARLDSETSEHRGGYSTWGSQRPERKTRLEEIASYIQTTEATFPNAIILAANYDEDGRYIDSKEQQWRVSEGKAGCWSLYIPSLVSRSASIIDGQHRLHAFERLPLDAPERDMELLCVVFLELPPPYHAYIFATINFNQKKVDRSLAYELFGFDLDERPAKFWSPDTAAVYLARLLNTDKRSPLYRCIFPAADSTKLFSNKAPAADSTVRVSMATVVDGILRLISKNPKEDRNIIRRPKNETLGRAALESLENLPLRDSYLACNDRAIYELVSNYFHAVKDTAWQATTDDSYLKKTVGIQAFFDVLKVLLTQRPVSSKNYSRDSLTLLLKPTKRLDPHGDKYQASGIGRADIRNELVAALKLE